jgi:hypothetical protein
LRAAEADPLAEADESKAYGLNAEAPQPKPKVVIIDQLFPDPAPEPPPPPVETFPCKGTGAKTWELSQEKLDEWLKAFPGVDVLLELRHAKQWLLDNPTRQKTRTGIPRFLGSWLGRAQNRAPAPPSRDAVRGRVDVNEYFGTTSRPSAKRDEVEELLGRLDLENPEDRKELEAWAAKGNPVARAKLSAPVSAADRLRAGG